MTDPVPDIDRIVREAWNASGPIDHWIVEIGDEYVITTNENDRSFARVPVEVGDTVQFGTPVPVVPGYLEMAPAVAASRVVFASRAESRPDVAATILDTPGNPPPRPPDNPPADPPTDEPSTPPEPGGVSHSPGIAPESINHPEDDVSDLSDIARGLGLPDDAGKDQILAAIAQGRTEPQPNQPDDNPDTGNDSGDQGTAPTQPEPAREPELVAAAAREAELRKEVQVLASQMQAVTTELAAARAKEAAAVKASVLQKAQDLGKFSPAERAQWERDYDEAPAVTTRLLDRIAPGTKVPVMASGYTGTGEESIDDEYERMMARLDGPTAVKGA